MIENYVMPYLTLKKLTNQFYEAINKKEFVKAYEISIDISDMASQLEDYAQNLVNNNVDA
jgi:hypothetical protein